MTEFSFTMNGVAVDVQNIPGSRGGRFRVVVAGHEMCDWEWGMNADDSEAGLKARATSEMNDCLEFNADPANFGDDEKPNLDLAAVVGQALGVAAWQAT